MNHVVLNDFSLLWFITSVSVCVSWQWFTVSLPSASEDRYSLLDCISVVCLVSEDE